MSRRHGKRDAKHVQIRTELRDLGIPVLDIANIGNGAPDLLLLAHGMLFLVEIKSPGGKLTPDEIEFCARWPVIIAQTTEEVIKAVDLAALGVPYEPKDPA